MLGNDCLLVSMTQEESWELLKPVWLQKLTHLFKVDVYVASRRWAHRSYCQEWLGGVPGDVRGRAGCIWSFDSVVKIQRHDGTQT